MKILFINKSDFIGGAAIAATRISDSLRKFYNADSSFIVAKKRLEASNIFLTRRGAQWFAEEAIDRVTRKLGFEYYYFPFSGNYILNKARDLKPDIISLHNIHTGYFPTELLKNLSKIAPIVWTLHDMWPITGHCSYSFECGRWESGCGKCPLLDVFPSLGMDRTASLFERKKRIYGEADMTIVPPSGWLTELSKKSPLFKGKRIIRIPHGIDTEKFSPKHGNEVRRKYGIKDGTPVLMFGAEKINDERKGGRYLLESLKAVDENIDFEVILLVVGKGGLGEEQRSFKNLKTVACGSVDPLSMPEYYGASDLLLFPTKADNLSLVLIESVASGTPALTFDTGGNSDIVKNGKSGFLLPSKESSALAEKVIDLLKNRNSLKALSKSAREYALQNFSEKSMADNYYNLFSSIIDKSY